MSDLLQLQQEIEKARKKLNELLVEKHGCTCDTEVANLSVCLDELIVRFEKLKSKDGKRR